MARRRRRHNPTSSAPVTIYTGERPARRRARSYERGGDAGGLGWLLLYGLGAYLLYTNWGTWFGGAAATVPSGGGAGAPTFWVRAEDGEVVASHTGPPSTAVWSGAWGTWTPADQATVDAANATASVITIS